MEEFNLQTKKLIELIKDRQVKKPSKSYTVQLFDAGIKRMAQKVGEEGLEVALAAQQENRKEIIYETADLWYHLLVLLASQNIDLDDIAKELKSRYH